MIRFACVQPESSGVIYVDHRVLPIANAGPTLIRLAERGRNPRERKFFVAQARDIFRSKRE